MGTSRIRPKVRRRKVAQLAANSRKFTVKNSTIPTVDSSNLVEIEKPWGKVSAVKGTVDYKVEYHKQPKNLRKKYKKKYYSRRIVPSSFIDLTINPAQSTHTIRKIVTHPSDYVQFPDTTFHPKGIAWYCEQLVQHKTARWEKKHPRPIKENVNEPDLFEAQYIPKWEADRDVAIERIRNFVVSVYDKLPLTGRYKESDNKFTEKPVAELKDVNGEGHRVNELNPSTSKLLDKAQKATNKEKAKNAKLVATNLKDHKRTKGRIILPKAA